MTIVPDLVAEVATYQRQAFFDHSDGYGSFSLGPFFLVP